MLALQHSSMCTFPKTKVQVTKTQTSTNVTGMFGSYIEGLVRVCAKHQTETETRQQDKRNMEKA